MLDLSIQDSRTQPFSYSVLSSVFSPDAAYRILKWLESEDRWSLATTDFYEQYEFSLLDVLPPPEAGFLVDSGFQGLVRESVQMLFDTPLSNHMMVVAHKLVPGQRIEIHNDMQEDGESHRLTVQLNRGLTDADGGFFMLFNSSDATDVHRILRPLHNTALAFAISEESNHAVSVQQGGVRYTLVFSFHAQSM